MLQLRSALFYLFFVTGVVVISLLSVVLASWWPFRPRFRFVTAANHWAIFWLRVCCGVRLEVVGRDNLPADGSFVIMANHQSAMETLFLQMLVGPQCTVLKKELLRIPFFGWGLALLKPIAIDRSKRAGAMKQILKKGKERLAAGIPVLIFPQGTRVPLGEKGKFNKGGAMLACSAGVPVLPVAHNAAACWPSGEFVKRPGVVRIEFGALIETVGRSVDEVNGEAVGWIEQRI
ncbi:lysophospholipid acyltransferase family protein [Motiliproteus sediminis]|uniref:lysophospholipid acyltransferase family protein n=1 Tax=Motiliproteus sediminis TaxID=1468178 RepID=UPI001AEF7CB7|nr:lysophospholipid acyltransferase family protein [Motiliproteus sediminis]